MHLNGDRRTAAIMFEMGCAKEELANSRVERTTRGREANRERKSKKKNIHYILLSRRKKIKKGGKRRGNV